MGAVAIELVFETHSITEDNELGRATGWLPGRLSPRGRELARELGLRRRDDGIAAVFSSDLRRATESASLAFEGSAVPVLLDWRLRECDYGQRNGMPVAELHASRSDHLDRPYPGGESWRQAVARAARLLDAIERADVLEQTATEPLIPTDTINIDGEGLRRVDADVKSDRRPFIDTRGRGISFNLSSRVGAPIVKLPAA